MLLVAAVIVALAIPFAMGIIGPRGEAQRELTAGEAWRRARRPPSSTIPVGPPFTATVTANIAQFVFPLPQQAEWEWHGPNAPASGLEYVWTVGVENEGRTSGFGSFLFNSGGPAARGSIDQLLDASQWTIFESDPKTNSYKVVRLGDGYNFRQVDVSVEGGNLIVRVEREDAYRYLFSGKPTHATFGIRKPNAKGEFEQTDQKVPIVYTEG
jgi:hypothetical protein